MLTSALSASATSVSSQLQSVIKMFVLGDSPLDSNALLLCVGDRSASLESVRARAVNLCNCGHPAKSDI